MNCPFFHDLFVLVRHYFGTECSIDKRIFIAVIFDCNWTLYPQRVGAVGAIDIFSLIFPSPLCMFSTQCLLPWQISPPNNSPQLPNPRQQPNTKLSTCLPEINLYCRLINSKCQSLIHTLEGTSQKEFVCLSSNLESSKLNIINNQNVSELYFLPEQVLYAHFTIFKSCLENVL